MYSGYNSLKNQIIYNGPNKVYNKFGYIPQQRYPPQPYNALLPYPQPSYSNPPLYSPPLYNFKPYEQPGYNQPPNQSQNQIQIENNSYNTNNNNNKFNNNINNNSNNINYNDSNQNNFNNSNLNHINNNNKDDFDSDNSKNNPFIVCNYELGNKKQKNYCLKFKEALSCCNDNIKYLIKPENYFSIQFVIKETTYIIKNNDDLDYSESSISKLLTKIKNLNIIKFNNSFNPQRFQNKETCNISSDNNSFNPQRFQNKQTCNISSDNNSQLIKNKTNKINLEKKKIEIINRMEKKRNDKKYLKEKNEKINQELEDMVIFGSIMKYQIKEEKENNPEKFIKIEDALKQENQDQNIFALALLASNLKKDGIEVVIQNSDKKEDIDVGMTCLQFIANGLIYKKKYDLQFDFGLKRNEELLNNQNEYEKFKDNLKEKISKDYKIEKNKIILAFPQRGSFRIQLIFQSDKFNNLDIKDFLLKFQNDKDFPELQNLKTIHEDVIMGGCKLTRAQLDARGNRFKKWGINEKRGNKPYNPPLGWIGIGLNVLDKYDNGDNKWIGMKNIKGEWCVAYHGIGRNQISEKVKKDTGNIIKGGFKQGKNQAHQNHDDQYHPGKKVGEGVYCTPDVSIAEKYSGISNINGINYKTVLMLRIKPSSIRGCIDVNDFWVVNGTTDEIRPYRILYKKC